MPSFRIETPQHSYTAVVERGILERTAEFLPAQQGKVFVVSTADVWRHQGERFRAFLAAVPYELLFLPGGEERKRLVHVESLAEEMVRRGGDRSSLVVAFGGGIVNDMAGFLAAIFMRGIAVLQAPTTLLAQVDSAIGGKTGVNLTVGKNMIGAFHQPIAVLVDPAVLETLPDREFRAGLYEIVKAGIIRDVPLFHFLVEHHADVMARKAGALDRIIADAVAMKAEVVSADERDGAVRRILNFGHTIGHALEAETEYRRFLHGEAVAFGMNAVVHLSEMTGYLSAAGRATILDAIRLYGPIPPLDGIVAENLAARLVSDKKTLSGKVHFVLSRAVGETAIVSGLDEAAVLAAIRAALG